MSNGLLRGASASLGEVIDRLAPDVLRVARAPADSDAPVNDVAILDPTDRQSVPEAGIVLGVGLAGCEGEAVTLLKLAGRRRAAAVVFRTDAGLPVRVIEQAESLDLALLTVPSEMAWGQLYSLIRTAIGSPPAEAGHPAGVAVGDLFGLANAIAAAVGAPITIEDPHWRVLAYSNLDHPIDEARRQTILGRTPPAVWQRRLEKAGVPQALSTGSGVVRFAGFEEEALAPRLAAPIRAGSELLGSIWAAEAGTPLGPSAESTLSRAAQLAVAHLISHRASEEIRRRTRGAFVREVLQGRVPSAALGSDLPLRTQGALTVLAFELETEETPWESANPERILSIVSLYCEDAHRDAMCALLDQRFWAVLPTPTTEARDRAVRLATKVVERVDQSVHVRLSAGIGVSVPHVAEVPRSRRAAEQALKVLATREDGARVVHIDDVQAHAVLLELTDLVAARPTLRQGKLYELLAQNGEQGPGYRATLRAYLDSSRDVGRAARRLGVHPNTMRYRVRRISELSGLDFDDPDERLVTELQLRMLDRGG